MLIRVNTLTLALVQASAMLIEEISQPGKEGRGEEREKRERKEYIQETNHIITVYKQIITVHIRTRASLNCSKIRSTIS